VFLGLGGVVVKSHGGTDAAGFANAVRIAVDMAQSPFRDEVAHSLARFAAVQASRATTSGTSDAAPALTAETAS
jgi:glycerol-3-phosphate acyltransferase PlsX